MNISMVCDMIARDTAPDAVLNNSSPIKGEGKDNFKLFCDVLKEKMNALTEGKEIKTTETDEKTEGTEQDITKDPFIYLLTLLGIIDKIEITENGEEKELFKFKELFTEESSLFSQEGIKGELFSEIKEGLLEMKEPAEFIENLKNLQISLERLGNLLSPTNLQKVEEPLTFLKELTGIIDKKENTSTIFTLPEKSLKEISALLLSEKNQHMASGEEPEKTLEDIIISINKVMEKTLSEKDSISQSSLKNMPLKTTDLEKILSEVKSKNTAPIIEGFAEKINSGENPVDNLGKLLGAIKVNPEIKNNNLSTDTIQENLNDSKKFLLNFLDSAISLEEHITENSSQMPSLLKNGFLQSSPLLVAGQNVLEEINSFLSPSRGTGEHKKTPSSLIEKAGALSFMFEQMGINNKGKGEISDNKGMEVKNILPKNENQNFSIHQFIENSPAKKGEDGIILQKESGNFTSILKSNIDMSDQILKKINWNINDEFSEATIKLEPEILGRLKVQINLAGGEVSAKFFAQSKDAGDLLSNQLQQLKNSLESQGLKLGEFSVFLEQRDSSYNFQNSFNNFRENKYYSPAESEKINEDFKKIKQNRIKTSQMDYLV